MDISACLPGCALVDAINPQDGDVDPVDDASALGSKPSGKGGGVEGGHRPWRQVRPSERPTHRCMESVAKRPPFNRAAYDALGKKHKTQQTFFSPIMVHAAARARP